MSIEISIGRSGEIPSVFRILEPGETYTTFCHPDSTDKAISAVCNDDGWGEIYHVPNEEVTPHIENGLPTDFFDEKESVAIIIPDPIRSQEIITPGGRKACLFFRQIMPEVEIVEDDIALAGGAS